jgi:septum formation protein
MNELGRPEFVLASASPRRLELLGRLGLLPAVVPAGIDESPLPEEAPHRYVERIAAQKATAVAAGRPGSVVLGADTAVVLDGRPVGKPDCTAEALAMLERHSGRSHLVLTAVAVVGTDGQLHVATGSAVVEMAASTDEERRWYVETGEPLDKAGAYAVQGAGAVFVNRVDGDPTTVIGLPLRLTVGLLRGAGLAWPHD